MNYREQIMQIVKALGSYYDKALTAEQIVMYTDDLQNISPADLSTAIKKYRLDPKNDKFPLPAKLIGMLNQGTAPDDIGREVSSRVIGAISKYGYTNPDKAEAFIGELGWLVVKRLGGWVQLCEQINNSNMTTWMAQIRDLSMTLHKRSESGIVDQAPSLSGPNSFDVTKLLKQMPKEIE